MLDAVLIHAHSVINHDTPHRPVVKYSVTSSFNVSETPISDDLTTRLMFVDHRWMNFSHPLPTLKFLSILIFMHFKRRIRRGSTPWNFRYSALLKEVNIGALSQRKICAFCGMVLRVSSWKEIEHFCDWPRCGIQLWETEPCKAFYNAICIAVWINTATEYRRDYIGLTVGPKPSSPSYW